jgi:nitroreductase
MDPVKLRAHIRERVHHLLEVPLYNAILRSHPINPETICKIKELLDIWEKRGLPGNSLDFNWFKDLLRISENIGNPNITAALLCEYDPRKAIGLEMMRKVLLNRRSIRNWSDDVVPDWMIDEILLAGLWAAHGCNLGSIRYIVLSERKHPGLFKGADVVPAPVHLIICQDMRVYDATRAYQQNSELKERNRLLDCGAAMQNMLLMAHGLGLGAVWLTFSDKMRKNIIKYLNVENHYKLVAYIDVGYPLVMPLAPGRHKLEEAVLVRE